MQPAPLDDLDCCEAMSELATNVLYYGDNLDILRRSLPETCADLVDLDPPFNSNRDDTVISGVVG